MSMTNRVPDWVTPIAAIFLGLALLSAIAIALDIYGRGHRLSSVASEVVWISSALYLGPFALPLYLRQGRGTGRTSEERMAGAAAGLPGGGASAIAHLIGVPLVIASGFTIAGIDLWVMIIVIGALAMMLLFIYERAVAAGRVSLGAAAVAAVLTVLAFDIGMGGWMLLLHFNEYMPPASDLSFWFLMQIGIVVGLATGYPVVRWLTRQRLTAAPA